MTERSSCRKQRNTFFCDSVPCLQKIHEHPQSTLEKIMESRAYRELNGIDGESAPVEHFQGHSIFELLHEIQKEKDREWNLT